MKNIDTNFYKVQSNERRDRIHCIFSNIAWRYDLINDLISFGLHRLWKWRLIKKANIYSGKIFLDLAGGTGDVASKIIGSYSQVVVCDSSLKMMKYGQQRPNTDHISWLAGEGEAIPLADDSVDTLTISFGIRNMTNLEIAISEMYRVLKSGGHFFCLEFSKPHWLIRNPYNFFSIFIIPRFGNWITKTPGAYTYLIDSIRCFPNQDVMVKLFRQAGFNDVQYYNLSLGIVCIHTGTKIL
ncbi:MAG: ubiquinone/menaquinone biosynthesis methyltransferase [Rhodospirillaceae bacterium]|jgi:demethylmenaquinone methyltransferase/2-methoxy-6-polyprenyl-1,4-benzoquinol methylase|nr:ubiquinone/menaquinone biosynthesis methyltransferase [Rhodospirillaceae bacterium]